MILSCAGLTKQIVRIYIDIKLHGSRKAVGFPGQCNSDLPTKAANKGNAGRTVADFTTFSPDFQLQVNSNILYAGLRPSAIPFFIFCFYFCI